MQAFLGEFIGTMTLILLGNGVVACVALKGSYGENGGWIVITTGWGIAVICAVIVALAVGSNAHLNPAVTIGVGVATGNWETGAGVHRGAVSRRAARRRARLAALPAALAATPTTPPASAHASARRRPCGTCRRTCSARSSARSCSCSSPLRSRRTTCRRTAWRRASDRSWSACSSGASVCRSAA